MGSILLMSAVTSVISPAVKRKKFRFFSSSHYRTLMRAKLWLSHRSRAGRKLCVVYATSARLSSRNTHSEDDMNSLFQILPCDLRDTLSCDPSQDQLLEVILDLGCLPQAHYTDDSGRRYLRNTEVSMEEIQCVLKSIGQFGGDNRAGIEGTLHRISAIRNRKGEVIGLTCRVGRARGRIDMVRDLLDFGESILFVGRPGVGKTTVVREISRVLSDELHKRVVIVDTSNEIGGDGDIPHPAIGGARRLQVPDPSMQHQVMIEAVENHMPEVIIIDEIGTEAEVHACRTIAERGVMLIGTAHGEQLENIIKNPTLCDLTERSVDALLRGKKPRVEVRRRTQQLQVVIERWKTKD
ncbi:uncharacterized protein ycf45 isoform X5 [Nicotiana tomentosiformis]|uniref:uncharacterized protein ycf45 isoform X5 n=1 Tax=Nicotiana tomentosiformis TaxID=4098 RepID=UPI0007BAA016|nr:PREDICTED: uncharacterized protein ycf45-like isoform X1 [Nicotiana tabacum]